MKYVNHMFRRTISIPFLKTLEETKAFQIESKLGIQKYTIE